MTTNIERAAEVLARTPYIHGRTMQPQNARIMAQALANAGLLMPAPTIIRTVEELEALDDDTFLMASDGNIYYAIGAKGRLLPSDIPAVVIRDGAEVRAARKALEEA